MKTCLETEKPSIVQDGSKTSTIDSKNRNRGKISRGPGKIGIMKAQVRKGSFSRKGGLCGINLQFYRGGLLLTVKSIGENEILDQAGKNALRDCTKMCVG